MTPRHGAEARARPNLTHAESEIELAWVWFLGVSLFGSRQLGLFEARVVRGLDFDRGARSE
jgi:hypothetical protein